MEPITLFTAGYEERSITEFIGRLKSKKISTLIDVREIPASRKPGFSKNRLKQHLEEAQINYLHIKELGSPKRLRHKLHENNDYDTFFKKYRKYLDTQLDIIETLYEAVVAQELCCIMCVERLPNYCHRKIVAEKIKEIDGNGLVITHI